MNPPESTGFQLNPDHPFNKRMSRFYGSLKADGLDRDEIAFILLVLSVVSGEELRITREAYDQELKAPMYANVPAAFERLKTRGIAKEEDGWVGFCFHPVIERAMEAADAI